MNDVECVMCEQMHNVYETVTFDQIEETYCHSCIEEIVMFCRDAAKEVREQWN